MATYTVQEADLGGTVLTFNSVNDPDSFANTGRAYILVNNASGATRTFDVVTTQTVTSETLAVSDLAISVDNGDIEWIGPFDTNVFSTTVTLQNWNATTGVTVAVFKV